MSNASSTPSFYYLGVASMCRTSWYKYTLGARADPWKTPTRNHQAMVVPARSCNTLSKPVHRASRNCTTNRPNTMMHCHMHMKMCCRAMRRRGLAT